MNPGADLNQAYSEWRRLALAEGQAIRAGDWRFVANCRQAISRLRATIESLSAPAQSDPKPANRLVGPRATILDLIELQRRSLASLEQRRQKLSAQVEELSRTGRNLRGIQRSYAPTPPPVWNSYS